MIKKRVIHLLAAMAICLGALSISENTKAANLAEVIYTYISTYTSFNGQWSKHDYTYKTISYINGFTYKETGKDITTTARRILGFIDMQYTRTYSVY